ncbi:MAG: PKD domain-containing protein [bacterium]
MERGVITHFNGSHFCKSVAYLICYVFLVQSCVWMMPLPSSKYYPIAPVSPIEKSQGILSDLADAFRGGIDLFFPCAIAAEIHITPGRSIQTAINKAVNGDEIIVKQGIYREQINFNGKAITIRSVAPDDQALIAATIIDGERKDSVIKFISGEGADSVLKGFTIKNGRGSRGGGIYCRESSPTIANCIISDNESYPFRPGYEGGGIRCENNSSPTITNCKVIKNLSGDDGGGISCYGNSSPLIINCLVAGNWVRSWGGGISSRSGCLPTIINCTITENEDGSGAGGLWCFGGASAIVTNCIIWNNKGSEIYGIPTITYSNIEGGSSGTGNINTDPLFADPAAGNYHLQFYSPCIDAGTSNGAPNFDILGHPRPKIAGYDMGAYEVGVTLSISPTDLIIPYGTYDEFTLRIENHGGLKDSYTLNVTGLPDTFTWMMQTSIQDLYPGIYIELPLRIIPSNDPTVCAIPLDPFQITLTSTSRDDIIDSSNAEISVSCNLHPPMANADGPYYAAIGESITLDGSGSYDIDESDGDSITSYGWEIDMIEPWDFDDTIGVNPTIQPFYNPGTYTIGLQVTDNTANAFPSTGSANLTDVDYTEIIIYDSCITDLQVRPKATKASLIWTHIGAEEYKIYRSEKGPNSGMELIGVTNSTYSTFMDYNVELYKDYWYMILADDGGNVCGSYPSHINSQGRIRNKPPQIISTPPLSAQEDQLYTYDVEAQDPDGNTITYILDQSPIGMTIDINNGLIEWTPTASEIGNHYVTIRAMDSLGASATQFYVLIVTPKQNIPPVAVPDGPYLGLPGQEITFDGSGSYDTDNDLPLTYQWNFGDGTISSLPNPTHIYVIPGDFTVTLYVTDVRGATGSAETTAHINTPPVADAGGPYSGHINAELTLNGSHSYDPDGDPLIYTWDFGDGTPSQTGVAVIHVFIAEGTYTINLSVDDGRGGIGTQQTVATIGPPNLPPFAQFTKAISCNPALIDFEDRFSGELITDQYRSLGVLVSGTSYWSGRVITIPQNGTDFFGNSGPNIMHIGDFGTSTTLTFVHPGTDTPTVANNISMLIGDGDASAETFTVEFFDLAGNIISSQTYTTRLGIHGELIQYTDEAASIRLTLEPSSQSGAALDDLSFNILPCGLGYVGDQFTFDGSFSSDIDGIIDSYEWDFGDGSTATGKAVTHTFNNPGDYLVSLTVTDDDGATSTATKNVSVVLNMPPEIISTPITTATEDVLYTYDVEAIDPDGDTLTYSITTAPSGMVIDTESGLINWTPTRDQAGTHSVDVLVEDGQGNSDNQQYTIHVIQTTTIVPNIIGLTQTDAETSITSAILIAGTIELAYSDTVPEGFVISQDPIAGAIVSIDSTVDFVLSLGVADIDLEPTSMDTFHVTVDSQTLGITGAVDVVIRNNGTSDVIDSYVLTLFEDINTNKSFDAGIDNVIGILNVPNKPLGENSIEVSVNVSGSMLFNGNLIYTFVDSSNQIDETDEGNNITHSMADCELKPPVGSFNPVLEWAWTSSSILPDSLNVMMTPAVIDLNSDEIPDIVFASTSETYSVYNGVLRAISGDNGQELFTITDPSLFINPAFSIAVGDIDLDGRPEIIACESSGIRLIAFEHDGTFKWRSEVIEQNPWQWGGSALSDINMDGKPEIIVGRQVINNEGVILWTGTGGRSYRVTGPLSFATDIDLDGIPEVVAGNTIYDSTGNIYWQAPLPDGFNAVANFDEDPYPEIVLVCLGIVYLLEHDGTIKWGPVNIPGGGRGGPPTVADFDNDSEVEIGVAGASRYSVFDTDGSIIWASVTRDGSSSETGSSIFDFDGDGFAEVVYRDELNLRVYGGIDGAILFETPMSSCTWHEYVLVADVDNDNNAEIIAVANNNCGYGPQRGIYVFGDLNDTWVNTRKIWNQHAYSITNVNDDGTIPTNVDNNWEIYNNFRQNQMLDPFGCIDLTASHIRVNQNNCPNMEIITRIGNGGALHTAPGLKVAFYDGDPDTGGTLLGTTTVDVQLNPGEYADISFINTTPLYKIHTLYVVADDDGTGFGTVGEIDEKNNKAWATFDLCNVSPTITSIPITNAIEDSLYSYDVEAADPDGDTLSYSLTNAPSDMTIDSSSGLIQWTPLQAHVGENNVTVQVQDGRGGIDTQSFTITVQNTNDAPQIISLPILTAKENITYSYNVEGFDIDGDTLTFTLEIAPPAMTIDSSTGLIEWIPDNSDIGDHTIKVKVTDPSAAFDSQEYTLSVEEITDNTPPRISNIQITPLILNPGETATITIDAIDNEAISSNALKIDGIDIPLVGNTATYTATDIGLHDVEATVCDISGHCSTLITRFGVRDPSDTTPPLVTITSPETDSELTEKTEIIGTVDDDNLVSYTLEYSEKDANSFTRFFKGHIIVISDVLGALDSTMLINGLYDIRLTAIDVNGLSSSTMVTYRVTGDLKVGNFSVTFKDLEIPVAGIPITIYRTYDSRIRGSRGDLGYGWNIDIKTTKIEENRVMGEGWYTESSGGIFKTYFLLPDGDHYVTITMPDGQVMEFDCKFIPESQLLIPILYLDAAVFTPRPGTYGSLEALDDSPWYLSGSEILNGDFYIYNPDRYKLTTIDGTVYIIDQNNGLLKVTDNNGNSLDFTSNGIIHSTGKGVMFTRDAKGRITKITDPMGNIIDYDYNANGDLIAVTDQEGNTSQYTYNSNHGLVDIFDPTGNRPMRNEYDYDGRLIAHIDAEGNRIEYTHDIDGRQEIVSDRLGFITLFEYDDEGNVTSKTDPLGNTTSYTYDGRGNKLSETDPLDNTTTYTYDAQDNMLTQTDPLGNTTTYTYNSRGQVLTITDPLGNITTNAYGVKGNLLTTTDPLGNVTINTYDDQGNLTSTTDALGNVITYAHDAYGNMLTQTDPLGNVTTYTYDDNGNQLTQTMTRTTPLGPETITTISVYDSMNRLVETIDPYGNSTITEYNAIGKQSATIDKNGNRTGYEYDSRGNLIKTTYPDGSTETTTYDAEGRKIGSTDRNGRTTEYIYDALGRLTHTIHPDGSSRITTYDAAGRFIGQTDERGNTTSYTYDAAGRRTSVTDPLGNTTNYTYDEYGNQLSMTDANGNTYTYLYDKNNNRIRTDFPDGTFINITYDALGRKITETDQAGITTQFEYDALGRLIKVTDALGQETSYTYDELGNKITQTDANGNTTTREYDNLIRVIKRTLPLGMSETMTYDGVGNMITKTDFNGDTVNYTYDNNNRLILKTYPDSSTVSFAYLPTGQRASILDSRGLTTFIYDERNRLLQRTDPDGTVISYTYDATGNRTSVTVPSGTTRYTFDELNRLATVTDPDSGITTYTYDLVGNRASVTYPNGTKTVYKYDTLNRLIRLENNRSDESIISSYDYTLGPSGNRIRVQENTGRIVDYTYDALYRLTLENITDPNLGDRRITYSYDPVGNRLSKGDTVAGSTNYTYDENDRLLTENAITYTYDNNGNTISKTEGTDVTTYSYDYENRLIGAQTLTSTINYTYNPCGIRVSSNVNGVLTNYLVDMNRDYAQVIEERDGGSVLLVSYIYGDDLISMNRGGVDFFYHYDGNGNTRQITDVLENITDTYNYDAFGIMLDQTGTTENNYLYTGEQYDTTVGFYYLRARYYNQNNGRFTILDEYKGNIYDPISLHKYSYCKDNPVNLIDPSGRFGIIAVMVSVSILTILTNIATAAYTLPISELPSEKTRRQLAGLIYAESGTKEWGGENSEEKAAIGSTVINRAYYATLTPASGRGKCYNQDFGSGTFWSAIIFPGQFKGYGTSMWDEVMSGDDMKSYQQLNEDIKGISKRLHLNNSISAAKRLPSTPQLVGLGGLGGLAPIAFNKATNSPPNPARMEKIGRHGSHTFYGFRTGRECD